MAEFCPEFYDCHSKVTKIPKNSDISFKNYTYDSKRETASRSSYNLSEIEKISIDFQRFSGKLRIENLLEMIFSYESKPEIVSFIVQKLSKFNTQSLESYIFELV